MIRTQIYIPEDLHQSAKLLAKSKSQPLAELLRKFIVNGIEAEQQHRDPKSLTSLTKLNITAGPKDLSTNMDKYLYNDD